MDLLIVIWLLVAHYIADFHLQTDQMALNKSRSNGWLTRHVAVYSAFMLLATWSLAFVAITFVCHWLTDYVTSRASSRLWYVENLGGDPADRFVARYRPTRHQFWLVIGLDQLLHQTQLILTYWWLLAK